MFRSLRPLHATHSLTSRSRLAVASALVSVLAGGAVGTALAPRTVSAASPMQLAALYSEAQAKRGEPIYMDECARCHSNDLMGGENSPGLVGNIFINRWNGLTAADMFERVRMSMPSDSPGRLSLQQYADVVAFMLSANKLPAGTDEFPKDVEALKKITLKLK